MKQFLIMAAIYGCGIVSGYGLNDCQAQTQYYYGPQGQSQGTATRSGNTTYYYGPQGQSAGTATQSGNTTYYYGPQGQSQGTTTAPSYNYNPAPIPLINQQSLTPQYDSIFGR
jgi:YD repeat-containing protein